MINSPTEITDCVLWLDANDESTMTFQDLTTEEINILTSWGVDYSSEEKILNTWTDKSINAAQIQMESTERPKYKTNVLNGKSVLSFDGNDSFWVPDNICNYENMTMILVGNCQDLSRPTSMIMTNRIGNKELLRIRVENKQDGPYFRLEAGREGGTDFVDTYFPAQENVNFIYSIQSLKGFLEGKINGQSCGIAKISCSESIQKMRVGTGNKSAEKKGIVGYIAEFIIFNRAISLTELTDVLSYLSTKWGIDLADPNPSNSFF